MSHPKKKISAELMKVHRKLLSDLTFASDVSLEEKRQIRVIAASGRADRTGDIVKVDGIDLTSYRKNPIILWAHDHYGLPVAKAVEMYVEKGSLVMVLEFATKEVYEFADTVYKLVKGGFLKGVSIGARVLEAEWLLNQDEEIIGRKFNKLELLELSVVPIPADSKALITAVKSGAISCEDMEECLAKSFDAPLDFPELNPVQSDTESGSTEEIVDMEKLAMLEQRLTELETKLATILMSSEAAQKSAASIEPVVSMLMGKLGVTTDGTPDVQSKLMALIETMGRKVSAPR
jgi:HK97 family phage prohead protease